MTSQKSFKSRVRDRMDKTGESYTAARRQILAKAAPRIAVRAQQASDSQVRVRSGRDFAEWFAVLDAWDATGRTHTEIARWLRDEHGVDGWSSQSITVAYEQERGLRKPGQGRDGLYSVSASKTIPVDVTQLFEAFSDPMQRERWLPESIRVRTANTPKTLRADWGDGTTRLAVGFTAVDGSKARVALAHERLTTPKEAARMKAFWRERLAGLAKVLTS